MGRLDRAELLEEGVVLGVRDGRIVEHVVPFVVVVNLAAQPGRALLNCLEVVHPSYSREATASSGGDCRPGSDPRDGAGDRPRDGLATKSIEVPGRAGSEDGGTVPTRTPGAEAGDGRD